MKPNLLAMAVVTGGAAALVTIVLIANSYGNQPSFSDMGLAAELGAAIGGALTFTWPFHLLKR